MLHSACKKFLATANSKLSCYLLSKHVRNSVYLYRDHYHRPLQKDTQRGSKYCPPARNELAEGDILSSLKNKKYMSREEWSDFKQNLIEVKDFISEDSFGVIVMNALISSNQLDLSHSLIDYLEQSPTKPNFLTYLKYISLCSKNYRLVDQKFVLKVIDKVKPHVDNSLVLDKKSAEYFIQGLCVTEEWRDSLKYLNKLIDSKPSRDMYNSIACAAVRNGDEAFAWEILTKWMNSNDAVSDKVIEEFLLVALKMQKLSSEKSDSLILKLFRYMQKRNVIISLEVAKLIELYFMCHHFKWKITYTKVSRKGICGACETCLEPSSLSDEEFKVLCSSFLNKAVKKSDLYLNTNSREFKNYMEFMNVHKPFHIVLDGLNAAYSFPGTPNKKVLASQLLKIVHILSGNSRKLLVLGRKHMQYWPKKELLKISQKAQLFFTDDISEDDPFVIYAALASGPHTYFLSDDLMRDHLSRLEDPKLIYLFRKWQLSRQVHIKIDEKNDIDFIEPVRHDIAIQGDSKDGWHIPYDDKIILDPYEELNNWLCIKRVE